MILRHPVEPRADVSHARQEYRLACEHYRNVLDLFTPSDPAHVEALRGAGDRRHRAYVRYMELFRE